ACCISASSATGKAGPAIRWCCTTSAVACARRTCCTPTGSSGTTGCRPADASALGGRGGFAAEQLGKELAHVLPGTLVRFLLVGHVQAVAPMGVGVRVGEAMTRAGQADEAVVGAGFIHL